jgi:glycosyltransferase involved in cell wall biosynthesis
VTPLRIAYFINVYPKVSHSFVRREIRALERLGHTVSRTAIRRTDEKIVDPEDLEEVERTRIILDVGPAGLATAVAKQAATNPRRFAEASRLASQLGYTSDRGLAYHGAYLAEACVLLDWLRAEGAEHLHAHFGTNSAMVAMLCHELGGPPFSFTSHGPEEYDRAVVLGLSEKIMRSKFVAAVSSFGRSQCYRLVPATAWDKVQVVRCGVDDVFLRAPPTPVPDVPRLVSVGRLHEQKGQLLLTRAAAQLRDRGVNFQLVLVGDGGLRAPIEAFIAEHKLGDVITITGWATAATVKQHLIDGRALVLPSFAEGLPVVIMEALALGRPVLSTYIAGIPELVEPEKSGWLVPAGSVDALVPAMAKVLETPVARLTEMGLAGRRAVEERHAVDKCARDLAELFARP